MAERPRLPATGHGGLRGLLPPDVVVEHRADDVSPDLLFPSERDVVASAVPVRQAEFATGRHCARVALAQLGFSPAPLLPGPGREPRWPAGVVGSVTHCTGYRAAAVARSSTILTIGIDAEVHAPLPPGVGSAITVGAETPRLQELGAHDPGTAWDRVLFSAKESIYKAWYPLARAWLDFTECELTIDPAGTFAGRLLVPGPVVRGREIDRFTGRWAVSGTHVLTACWEA